MPHYFQIYWCNLCASPQVKRQLNITNYVEGGEQIQRLERAEIIYGWCAYSRHRSHGRGGTNPSIHATFILTYYKVYAWEEILVFSSTITHDSFLDVLELMR